MCVILSASETVIDAETVDVRRSPVTGHMHSKYRTFCKNSREQKTPEWKSLNKLNDFFPTLIEKYLNYLKDLNKRNLKNLKRQKEKSPSSNLRQFGLLMSNVFQICKSVEIYKFHYRVQLRVIKMRKKSNIKTLNKLFREEPVTKQTRTEDWPLWYATT